MQLNHIGVVNQNEEQAVKFYSGLLGLSNTRSFILSPELSGQLFSVKREVKALVFEGDGIKIEVFIASDLRQAFPDFAHFGLLLSDFHAVLDKAAQAGVEIISGSSGDKTVYFLKDLSGNLIEIKPG